METALNTIIIDDHPPIVEVIKHLAECIGKFRVIGSAGNKDEINNLNFTNAEIVILDLRIPGIDWEELLEKIQLKNPTAKIMVFSMLTNSWIVNKLYKKGIRHFVSKSVSISEVKKCMVALHKEESYFSSDISPLILNGSDTNNYDLTPKEKEVLKLIYDEKTSNEIASILGVSINTIGSHRKKIYQKLDVNKITELIKVVDRNNLLG